MERENHHPAPLEMGCESGDSAQHFERRKVQIRPLPLPRFHNPIHVVRHATNRSISLDVKLYVQLQYLDIKVLTKGATMWDPGQYSHYADERSRPFYDLIGRTQHDDPAEVVDLGCGPGNLTAVLAQRWPHARVLGIDNSQEMLLAASSFSNGEQIRFEAGDVRTWHPASQVDVIVSNATLQWVPEHVDILATLYSFLRPGGWFAFQVPGNFTHPSHAILAELRLSPRWRERVGAEASRHLAVCEPSEYADRLGNLGAVVDAWETTYLHLLSGPDPVLEWVKGTGLRPVLAALTDPAAQSEFLSLYAARLREAYPVNSRGITPFPFRRIFVVAQRPA